ncbi:Myosin type-2 heavy chain 1, partial [Cladochytrium tenue]
FADRYYLLVPSAQWTTDARALTARVVQAAIARADLYQQGTTKIFFRAGQLALLERLRSERLRECVVCIQKNIRRLITRKRYLRMRAAAIKIQTAWRAYRARELFRAERERLAAIKIQKYARRWLAMKRLRKSREAAVRIQTVYRMHRARAELDDLRRYRAAVRIQKLFRGFLARRWYRLTIRQIVLLQSCVRRRRAMRELRVLKTEARSVGKLKELNYKLENKVVELSQALKARDEEVRALTDKVGSLESHVGSWKDKFSRADSSSRAANAQLNEGSTEMRADLKAAVEARDAFQRDAERATAAGAKKDAEIEALKQELARSRDDVRRLREEAKSAAPPPPKLDDAAAAAALRKEVASLREQMSRLIAGKWTRDRVADSLLQAAEGSGGYAFAGERPAPGSAAAAAASAAAAAAAAAAASAGQPYWTHGQADQLGAEAAIAARPRPASAADIAVPPPEMFSAGRNSAASRRSTASSRASSYASYASSGLESALTYTNGADERAIEAERAVRALEDKALEDEILDGLIANLRIPLPSTQTVATRREIFFPAHLVGAVMQQQLRHDLAARLQQLTGSVLRAVRALTMKFEDDYVSAFWLSNCFELLAVVRLLQEREARRATARATAMTKAAEAAAAGPRYGGVSGAAAYGGVGAYGGGAGGFGGLPLPDLNEGARTLDKVRDELDGLAVAIYRGWIKELKKRLGNMVVPAVIENQSLPGYVCKQSGGLWGRWGGGGGSKGAGGSSSAFTIEQLLNFLSKLSKTMRCYYMDEAMTRQILTELLRVIGVSAFNHLLMRKNFCTWKRGVQIQYNVSRLEEWCASHGVGEATLHLQQLLQAGKLLTLNKTSPQDLETVFDVCFLLNATQVKKLLSLYYAADFDSPLSPELLRSVASRAVVNEKQDALLLDLDAGEPDVAVAPATAAVAIDPFVPAWVSLPRLSAVVAATAPPQPPQAAGEIEA